MQYDVLVDHPIDDPELVSYVRPELRALSDELERVRDCFNLLRGDKVKGKYLAQEYGEPDEAYIGRLNRSTYTPVFRDAIRAFAGLLGNYQVSEPPKSLDDNLENVDMMGSSLNKFLGELDQLVLRDGGAAVLVEMPPEQQVESALEEIEAGRRPYLVPVERADVINWRTRITGGREIVEFAVIRTVMEMPSEDGQYGCNVEPVYVLLTPGQYQKIRLVRNNNSRWTQQVIEQGMTSLPTVPLVWYGSTGSRFGIGSIPLAGLADLSIQHYQLRSDLAELIHKLSMPVAVRKGAPTDMHGRPAPLTIGPNTAIDLPVEGSFEFAEPNGSSLAQHQAEITHVEALMDRSSLAFIYGSQTTKTATEAVLQGAQIQAQVATLIENKESAFDLILRLWTSYTGEKIALTTGIEISDNLIQRPLEAQEVQAYLGLFGANAISHQTLLEELQRGHALSQEIDVEEEIKRISEEKRKAQEEAVKNMQAMAEAGGGPEAFAPAPGNFSEDEKTVDPKKEQEAKAGSGKPAAGKTGAKGKPPAK